MQKHRELRYGTRETSVHRKQCRERIGIPLTVSLYLESPQNALLLVLGSFLRGLNEERLERLVRSLQNSDGIFSNCDLRRGIYGQSKEFMAKEMGPLEAKFDG
eukprot:GFKZ01007856.1.p1 GENE.GFKZ01007856.1~~GFKZ01007856.1.p1  ORF type:complete len:103 (-),score=4.59 GFKZ01007856.1:284-592(-)